MTCVGITGGIGSGKSLVSTIFRAYGYAVYDSDYEAKQIYERDEELKAQLIAEWGCELYNTADGRLNRKRLAEIIFSSDEARARVNQLVHPAVARHFLQWREALALENKLCFVESAILLQCELQELVDAILLVSAEENLRLERAVQRDKVSVEAIKQRIRSQLSDEEMRKKADFVIFNDRNQALIPQINNFLGRF